MAQIGRFKDFETTKAYTDAVALPQGGYVCKLGKAIIINNQYGQHVEIPYEIVEGEFKGYYKERYDANTNEDKKWPAVYWLNVPNDDGSERDGWTKRAFKTFTDALEASNPGYHFNWDTDEFNNKLIGLVTRREEWINGGQSVWTNRPFSPYSTDDIRSGNFKYPKDKPAKNRPAEASGNDYVAVTPTVDDSPIPFD